MIRQGGVAGLARWAAAAEWLDAARVRRWGAAFLVVQLACALIVAAGSHGWLVPLHGAGTTDFVSFYAAGKIAAGPAPALAYDRLAHYAAERAATAPGIPYIYFFYPPVWLIVCRALAWLPYLVAFYVFAAASTALLIGVVRAIWGRAPGWWYLPVLGFSPLIWNDGFGQNACLTAALLGGGCVLLQRRRDLAAGLVLGLLFYKPHTGLLLPLVLVAGGCWRAIVGAAISVGGVIAASVALFGWAVWPAFVTALGSSGRDFSAGGITPFATMVNVAGSLRDHGVGAQAALIGQGVAQVLVAAGAVWCWRGRRDDRGARYAVLVSGAILVMPVVLFYDLTLLTVAAAFIAADARRFGFVRYEKILLAAAWLAGGVAYPLARAWHLPLGLGCCLIMFGIALRRHRAARCHCLNDDAGKMGRAWLDERRACAAALQNERPAWTET